MSPALAMLVAAIVAVPAAADGSGQGDPGLDYVLQCQGCHLADGAGVEASGIPPLQNAVGRFLQVEGGRAYLVQVPGVANAPLEDRDLAALLNWMLLRFSPAELPRPFVPYSEPEVAAFRREALPDPAARRAALLSLLEVRDAPPPP